MSAIDLVQDPTAGWADIATGVFDNVYSVVEGKPIPQPQPLTVQAAQQAQAAKQSNQMFALVAIIGIAWYLWRR